MFIEFLSAVCWPSDDGGPVTSLSMLVAGHPYAVRFVHADKCFQVSNGIPSTVLPNAWSEGKNTVTVRHCRSAAEAILRRELKRRGRASAPKAEAVLILAKAIHQAFTDAYRVFNATPACGCNELQYAGCDC